MDLDDIVSIAPNQVSSRIGDEVAILGLDRGVYYGLNASGARIWELLQQPIRVRDIHTTLTEEYEVDAEAAKGDLLEVLNRLLESGLIERRHA